MGTASLDQVLTTAASGMSAQTTRINTIASNLANAGTVGSSEEGTYHTKYPIFSEVKQAIPGLSPDDQPIGGVQVTGIQESQKPLQRNYDPGNPSANEEGFIYMSNVNPIEEMTNMISASREYQANVDVMNTTKNLIMQSINVINSK